MPTGRIRHPKHPFTDLTPEQFAHAIQRGLGRAYLFVRDFDFAARDFAPYRDILLDACLKSTLFEVNLDNARDSYLYTIVTRTPEPAFYRQHILKALLEIPLDASVLDRQQVAGLVVQFAHENDAEARQALYTRFNQDVMAGSFWVAGSIVRLDGESGFAYIAERYPRRFSRHRLGLSESGFLSRTG